MAIARVKVPTKAEAAYQAIRDAIRDGQIRPGERITLQALAVDLGMSLTPVREALRMLASQGLVEQTPNHSTVVTEYTLERAEEIYRLRLVLEPLAAELAASQATAEDLEAIEAAFHELESAIRQRRAAAVPELNAELHSTIYRAARSSYLLEFIERLWSGVPFQALSLSTATPESSREHRAIIDAVKAHRPQDAAKLTREHIARAASQTMESLAS